MSQDNLDGHAILSMILDYCKTYYQSQSEPDEKALAKAKDWNEIRKAIFDKCIDSKQLAWLGKHGSVSVDKTRVWCVQEMVCENISLRDAIDAAMKSQVRTMAKAQLQHDTRRVALMSELTQLEFLLAGLPIKAKLTKQSIDHRLNSVKAELQKPESDVLKDEE